MRDIDWLKGLCETASGPYLRPFSPNAEWHQAQVFIVGTNPATPLRAEFRDFESYWHALTEAPDKFNRVYAAKHGAGASKSTLRARRFLQHLKPLNALVTNAYVYPATRPGEIPNKKEQQRIGIEVFDFLYRTCRPKSILFYGSEAIGMGEAYFGLPLDPYVSAAEQPVPGADGIQLFAMPHFSGQGVRAGYRVSEMDHELRRIATRIQRTFKGD